MSFAETIRMLPENIEDATFSLDEIRDFYNNFVDVIDFEDYADMARDDLDFELDFELETLYVSYLCIVGDIKLIQQFLNNYNENQIKIILNNNSEFIYYGTPLNETLFWNKDSNAIEIYSYLRSLGAVPYKNHYNFYPWEYSEDIFDSFSWYSEILPAISYRRYPQYMRDNQEFAETCQKIQEYEKIYTEIYSQEIYQNYTFSEMIENLNRIESTKHFLYCIEEELIEITWNPNRFVDWCLDQEEKRFITSNFR